MPSSRFSNNKFHREPSWRSYTRVPSASVPQALRDWLLDQGSLTQRLIAASDHQFRVCVLKQQIEMPRLSERMALNQPMNLKALVREVLLFGGDTAWVYARSVMPLKSLSGSLRRLRKLDSRPLGALLFSDPSMRRGPIEIACITPQNSPLPSAVRHFDEPLWGRRSVFWLCGKPLLVSEIFLPTFTPYNKTLIPTFPRASSH